MIQKPKPIPSYDTHASTIRSTISLRLQHGSLVSTWN